MKHIKPSLTLKCSAVAWNGDPNKGKKCSCGQKLKVYDLGDGEIDVGGVILNAYDVSKLIDVLIGTTLKK